MIPVKVIVDRVIDAAAVFASVAHIDRRDAQVVEERAVIAPGTERPDADVRSAANFLSIFVAAGGGDFAEQGALPHGNILLRILDVTRDAVHEVLERVRTLRAKIASPVAVAVDVGHGMLL